MYTYLRLTQEPCLQTDVHIRLTNADTHIHASQYPNAGIFGRSTLLDWLKTYTYPIEASLSDTSKARRVYSSCISRTIAHGTTTAAYYATIHVESTNLLASLCHSRGQRALIGRICMDHPSALVDYYRDESASEALSSTHAVINHVRTLDPTGERLAPILTPRSAVSCTSELMSALGALSHADPHGLRIQTHLSENKSEIELVSELWPNSKSYTHVYDDHDLLTERTILAHVVHLTHEERKRVAKRKSKVAHCPVSNSALASGMCPVRTLLDDGITVGLGTDISGGYSPSMLEAVRQACMISQLVGCNTGDERARLSLNESLWLATRGGAEVVGWKDRIGAFETGMQWDAQLIELDDVPDGSTSGASNDVEIGDGNVKIFGWESREDRVAKWVYGGDDRNTQMVWVGGRMIHSRKA